MNRILFEGNGLRRWGSFLLQEFFFSYQSLFLFDIFLEWRGVFDILLRSKFFLRG